MAKSKDISLTLELSEKNLKEIEIIAEEMNIQPQELLKQTIEIYLEEFIRNIKKEKLIRKRSLKDKHQFVDNMCGCFQDKKIALTQKLLKEREKELEREERKIHIR